MNWNLSGTLMALVFTCCLSQSLMASPDSSSESAPLLPEATDPVLGHRAAVIEWAWSPEYAERFGLPVQEGGLENGYLWLVGIKVVRMDFFDRPTYRCRIVGLLENDTPIVWPPGERYVMHPSHLAMGGGLPGQRHYRAELSPPSFTPGQSTWFKGDKGMAGGIRDYSRLGVPYLFFHKSYTKDLAYFELDASCLYFGHPSQLKNRLSFPTTTDESESASRAYKKEALWIDFPDMLVHSVFAIIESAQDWSACLSSRSRASGRNTLLKDQIDRLGDTSCDAINDNESSQGR